MIKLNQFLRNSFDKKIDGTGLAIFRIAYSIILLCEIAQMFYFKELIFDKVPFIEPAEISFAIPIGIWFISVLFILFGAFTRFFTIINYLLSLILIGSITTFEYHVFYAYMGINFLLIFLPVSQCLSLDRLIKKLKYSNTNFQYNPSKNVSQLYYFIPTFIAVGLIYFDSIFVKLTAHSWQTGLGMWMPSSFPMMVHSNLSFLLNKKILMLFLGYLTLAFEASFIFLFFRKKFRLALFIIGVGLHLGILVAFPIPWFALTYCAIYLLLIPVSFWQKLFRRKENLQPKLFVYYDAECPLCVRTKIAVSHFNSQNKIIFKTVQFDANENESLKNISTETLLDDIHSVDTKGKVYNGVNTYIKILSTIWYFKPLSWLLQFPGINYIAKKAYNYIAKNRNTERCTEENCGYNPPEIPNDATFKILQNFTLQDLKFNAIKYLVFAFSLIQIIIILNSPLVDNFKDATGLRINILDKISKKTYYLINDKSKTFFGLTRHDVFIDEIHFNGYSHVIAIAYKNFKGDEIWLPLINKKGQPDYYNYGTNWRKMSFSCNNPNINKDDLYTSVRDFTAFWAKKNNIDLQDATFLIKVKKIDSPNGWEKDFLNKQIAKPWIDGGYVLWKENKMNSFIKDIEKL